MTLLSKTLYFFDRDTGHIISENSYPSGIEPHAPYVSAERYAGFSLPPLPDQNLQPFTCIDKSVQIIPWKKGSRAICGRHDQTAAEWTIESPNRIEFIGSVNDTCIFKFGERKVSGYSYQTGYELFEIEIPKNKSNKLEFVLIRDRILILESVGKITTFDAKTGDLLGSWCVEQKPAYIGVPTYQFIDRYVYENTFNFRFIANGHFLISINLDDGSENFRKKDNICELYHYDTEMISIIFKNQETVISSFRKDNGKEIWSLPTGFFGRNTLARDDFFIIRDQNEILYMNLLGKKQSWHLVGDKRVESGFLTPPAWSASVPKSHFFAARKVDQVTDLIYSCAFRNIRLYPSILAADFVEYATHVDNRPSR